MKLSIITVNFNNRDGLQKTIDSVVSQTFRDFEWIVIDGGSTDGSKELIEQYADHFAYWVSEPDKGIYNAMNKGIKAAKGDYLQFLNSGDWLFTPDTLEQVFNLNRREDIIFGASLVHDPFAGDYILNPDENISAFELLSTSLPHQASFIKHSIFKEIGLYDESYRIVADMKFFYEAIIQKNKSLFHVPFTIVHYDGSGLSNQSMSTVKEETLRVIDSFLSDRFKSDFLIYNDVILSKKMLDKKRETSIEEKKAIRLYKTMMRYWPTRIITQLLYQLLITSKRQKNV